MNCGPSTQRNARAYAERSFNISDIADRFLDTFSKNELSHSEMELHFDSKLVQ